MAVGTGTTNVYIGSQAGYNNDGNGNVLLGYLVGNTNNYWSNVLAIDNSDTTTPLIYGDFSANTLRFNGSAQFGTATAGISTFSAVGNLNLAYGLTASTGVFTSTLTVQGNAFSVGGSTLVVAGGNVGIGTTGPAQKLHMSSGTLLIDGNAATPFQIGISSFVIRSSGAFSPQARTKAQIDLMTPVAVGEYIDCTDCTLPGLCRSSGTAVAQWRKVESSTLGCGSGN